MKAHQTWRKSAPLHAVLSVALLAGVLMIPRLVHAAAAVSGQYSGDSDTKRMQSVLTGAAEVENAGGFGTTGSFQFTALASNDSGTIRVFASQRLPDVPNFTSVQAVGNVSETLTFSGSSPGVVRLSLSVIGYFQNAGNASEMLAIASLSLGDKNSQLTASWRDFQGSPVMYSATPDVTGIGNPNEPSQIRGTLNVQMALSPGATVGVLASVQLNTQAAGSSIATAGFDHTAQLALELPAGWTFTSQSGTFLSVPEPSRMVLLAVGAFGMLSRRGRRGASDSI